MVEAYVVMIIIIAVLVAAGAFAVYVFGYDVFWLVRNWLAPVTRTQAKVMRKRHKQWDISIVGETPEMGLARLGMMGRDAESAAQAYNKLAGMEDVPELTLADGTDCYVTFGLDGKQLEFLVPMDTYIALEENTEGLLVFKGEKFLHFIAGV